MTTVLVTGAAGYIGSHACVALLGAGHDVVGIDNFANSSPLAVGRIEEVAGRPMTFVEGGTCWIVGSWPTCSTGAPVDAAMHFAGRKAVGESVAHPMRYYENNLSASVNLFAEMAHQVCTVVFSSSCTVYGDPERTPVDELAPLRSGQPVPGAPSETWRSCWSTSTAPTAGGGWRC